MNSLLNQKEWLNTKPHVGGIQCRLELAVLTELFFLRP
jgi:hypothetical protein